ncbi:hypothetical protein B0T26DRAFT_709764 [Lasiosphaeria miniovina]|uniref:Uncharacterized protein n=1 Tax=Lasiosphaeria miniovina TaxID=1954250 RepID=A0AA40DUZ2_9PEZI|nr:uncharacterized protein B0T26DRAFT_709764 [Lasiosphaeria miniovina]KAK0717379.1 hypothetical protein B0T26DRAFT_709764 [Lasiosphaeria miniovina]
MNERVNRFLHSVVPNPVPVTLLEENRSLHQRVSALQGSEQELLKENQNLAQQLATQKQHHETRRRQWKNDLLQKEHMFEARLRGLEEQIAEKERELMHLSAAQSHNPSPALALADHDIVSWFSARTTAWHGWARDFAHPDPDRVRSALHPKQLAELCEGVKGFVRLTDDGRLPEELLASAGDAAGRTTQVLLHGLLANFVVTETLQSPFWVFDALSTSGLELESPSMPRGSPMSPVGFRMDLAMWNNVAPVRSARLPQPKTPRMAPEPFSPRRLPPLVTSMKPASPLNLTKVGLPGPSSNQGLPAKADIENLHLLLSHVQQSQSNTNSWRAQLMQILSEGGLSVEPENAIGEGRRVLAEARQNYARKLKDRFLSGAARFLLREQNQQEQEQKTEATTGNNNNSIEKLERHLVNEFDAALRFSCRVWSRHDPLRLRGLSDLAAAAFTSSNDAMDLCQAQADALALARAQAGDQTPRTFSVRNGHEGHSVVVVLQPAVDTIVTAPENGGQGQRDVPRMWSKARVFVAPPRLVMPAPACVADLTSPAPVTAVLIGSRQSKVPLSAAPVTAVLAGPLSRIPLSAAPVTAVLAGPLSRIPLSAVPMTAVLASSQPRFPLPPVLVEEKEEKEPAAAVMSATPPISEVAEGLLPAASFTDPSSPAPARQFSKPPPIEILEMLPKLSYAGSPIFFKVTSPEDQAEGL